MEKLLQERKLFGLAISRVAKDRIIFVISLAFIFLYCYTGFDKLNHLEKFSKGISKIPYVGGIAVWIGWGVPLVELMISVLLIIPKSNKLGMQLATGLMGLFTLYLGLMMAFVEKRLCHCGGVIESMGWVEHLLFNLLFVGLGGWALYLIQFTKSNTK